MLCNELFDLMKEEREGFALHPERPLSHMVVDASRVMCTYMRSVFNGTPLE